MSLQMSFLREIFLQVSSGSDTCNETKLNADDARASRSQMSDISEEVPVTDLPKMALNRHPVLINFCSRLYVISLSKKN